MEKGDLRREYCDDPDCKCVTTQRLVALQKNGRGDVIAQQWRCIEADHTWKKAASSVARETRMEVALPVPRRVQVVKTVNLSVFRGHPPGPA
jgi:hypothetical protein